MLRAFFDETNVSPGQSDSLIVGGFLGMVSVWEEVSNEWDACLNAEPRIDHFSSNEYRCRSGQFGRLGDEEVSDKILALARVIAAYNIQGVCTEVPHAWFSGRDRSASKGMVGTRVYDWGFINVTSGALQYLRRIGIEEKLDFVFDNRGELRSCISLFYELKGMKTVKVMEYAGECSTGDDRLLAPLQMADLLCGEFSSVSKGPPTDAWRVLAARGVLKIDCDEIGWVSDAISLQKQAAEVERAAHSIQRRIHRDKESSTSLRIDLDALYERKALLDLQLMRYEAENLRRIQMAEKRKVR